jgi:hypothetical protein
VLSVLLLAISIPRIKFRTNETILSMSKVTSSIVVELNPVNNRILYSHRDSHSPLPAFGAALGSKCAIKSS